MSATTPAAASTGHGDAFAALRAREFPGVLRAPYLNAASVAPLPERARRAAEAYQGRRADPGSLTGADFDPVLARCRAAAARLVGGDADEIALLPNTSFALSLPVLALARARHGRIVVSAREFPANVYPWMGLARAAGIEVELVPTDAHGNPHEARLMEALHRAPVSVFALSAVQFTSGWRADLAAFGEVCRARGILFVVDAIQALGQVPIDARAIGADVLGTGGHKWLCGPFGTGFAWVRRELVDELEPAVVGWTSMQASADYARVVDYRYRFVTGARRLEVGTQPFHDYAAFAESLELLIEAGPDRILRHVLSLLAPLEAWLRDRGVPVLGEAAPARRSGILGFRPRDPDAVLGALGAAGIGCVVREGAVRLSPHLYNTPDDIGAVIDVLAREMAA